MTASPPARSESGSIPPRSELNKQHLVSRATLAVALGGGLVLLVVSLLSPSTTAHRTLAGSLTITPRSTQGDACATSAAYPDLRDGAPIVVRDADGHEVGKGRLGNGKAQGGSCVRSLDIEPVPVLPEYHLVVGATGPLVVTDAVVAGLRRCARSPIRCVGGATPRHRVESAQSNRSGSVRQISCHSGWKLNQPASG